MKLPFSSYLLMILFISSLVLACDSQKQNNERLEWIPTPSDSSPILLKEGDLIFHTSKSSQSQAIQIATNSKYSHMGILYRNDTDWFVYEAVQPVKLTPLKEWINRGEQKHYVIKRIKDHQKHLNSSGIEKLKTIGKTFYRKDYDLQFQWSDDRIYCSELVWKMYKQAFNIEIGSLEQFGDFDLSEEVVQSKVKERYSGELPKDEWVITPDRMFKSNMLMTVQSNPPNK